MRLFGSDRFGAQLRGRIVAATTTNSDTPVAPRTVGLVDVQLKDVCGWLLLLWNRVDRVSRRDERIGEKQGTMADHEVRVRTWVRGSDVDVRSGLLGYLSVSYGALLLDGITLRRTASGRSALSFPAKTDRAGRRHSYVQPVDDEARCAIEREILAQLGGREELVP